MEFCGCCCNRQYCLPITTIPTYPMRGAASFDGVCERCFWKRGIGHRFRESIFVDQNGDTIGEGYTLQMVAKEGYHYELNIEDMGTGLETIFIRDNDVY